MRPGRVFALHKAGSSPEKQEKLRQASSWVEVGLHWGSLHIPCIIPGTWQTHKASPFPDYLNQPAPFPESCILDA